VTNTGYKLDELAGDWRWLFDPADYTLLTTSPFGDLVLQDRSGAICLLDVNLAQIVYATNDGSDLVKLFPNAFDDRLASRYRDGGLVLAEGQCYGFKTPVVTAESSFEPSNVYVAPLVEYVNFMGDFGRQISDVEDGQRIRLKVGNLSD
jgi:hypothetical protein